MKIDKNPYIFLSYSSQHDLFKSEIINIFDGFICISVQINNNSYNNTRILKFILSKFQQFFKFQRYDNPKAAISESVSHVGRQLYLEAAHDETLSDIKVSCAILYHRENELLVTETGALEFKNLTFNSISNTSELKNISQTTQKNEYLSITNFHSISPVVYVIAPSVGDIYILSTTQFFDDEKEVSILLESVKKIEAENVHSFNFNNIDYPVSYLKILETKAQNHTNDKSFLSKFFSSSYLMNIPKRHLFIFSIFIATIILILIIFKPEEAIHNKEKEIIAKTESLIKKEESLINQTEDTVSNDTLSENNDVTTGLKGEITMLSFAHYKVDPKENLYRISKNFNTSINRIQKINNITNNTIYPGQTIQVPVQATYIVNEKETIQEISKHFNIDVPQLLNCNKLHNSDIKKGMKLLIPNSYEE
ncbi:MAG: LysM peptidoglycan-binding domain-containing protein [Prolixibacteraceae bacterium]|nr:LysM peptidoglycan-binding domain-containing protein [Prolixibacteraceae bacterium]